MKNITKFLVAVLLLTGSTHLHAQAFKKVQLTPEQKATLQTKRMALLLDLNENQQDAIYKLNEKRAVHQREFQETVKQRKLNNIKPTSDEIFNVKLNRLNSQIAYKKAMEEILSKDQFEKWKKYRIAKLKHKQKGKFKTKRMCR
ncbi:hypothetical protein [Lutibacter sp.]